MNWLWLTLYILVFIVLTVVIFFPISKKKTIGSFPVNGQFIRLTWLPEPKNGWPNQPREKNCYIGSEGIVEDMKEDGSFFLRMSSGATLVVGTKYKWIEIEYWFKDGIGGESRMEKQKEWTKPLIADEIVKFYDGRVYTKPVNKQI